MSKEKEVNLVAEYIKAIDEKIIKFCCSFTWLTFNHNTAFLFKVKAYLEWQYLNDLNWGFTHSGITFSVDSKILCRHTNLLSSVVWPMASGHGIDALPPPGTKS